MTTHNHTPRDLEPVGLGIVGACAPTSPEVAWPPHWQQVARRVRSIKRAILDKSATTAACGHTVTDRLDLHWSADLEDEVCPDCCQECD